MVSSKQQPANSHFGARADGQREAHSAAKTIVRLAAYVHTRVKVVLGYGTRPRALQHVFITL